MNTPRFLLPRPAKHERGEGRGEGLPRKQTNARRTTSPRPSPPSNGGEGVPLGCRRPLIGAQIHVPGGLAPEEIQPVEGGQ
jgi:hypothetical protein